MAVRKTASLKKKLSPKKTKRTPAPGKPDPMFLTRLSRAVEEGLRSADGAAARPKAGKTAAPRDPGASAEDRPEPLGRTARPADDAGTGAPDRTKRDLPPEPRRAAEKKAAADGKNRRAALLKELKAVLAELDEEGLDFLLEQAHVHRYNMEVDRLNEAEERRETARAKARQAGPGTGKGKAGTLSRRTPPLRIERSQDGNTYHVVSGGRYKMFSAEEMLSLVRIAHANPDDTEAGRGLHRWMSRERTDALADLGYSGPSDPGLAALAGLIRKSFAAPPKRA